MWKRVKRIGLLLIIGFVLLGGGALVVVQTDSFQQWLLRRIEQRASAAGYRVSAQRLRVDIWNLRASVEGLTYNDDATRATVQRALVDIRWNAFRTEIIHITNLEADGVAIELHPPSQPAAKGSGTIPRITFDSLAIRNASLTYSDPSTTIHIPSVSIEMQNGRGSIRMDSPVRISPDLQLGISGVTLQAGDQSLDFDLTQLKIQHPQITVTGKSSGHLRWSPALAMNLDFSTNPFTYGKWRDLQSSGKVVYENGILKANDIQARIQAGTVNANAEITDHSNSVNMRWSAVNLAPADIPAITDGEMQLRWKVSDFSDASGKGAVVINSRQYGRAQSDITIQNARANLQIRANAFDSALRADVTTGLDQTLSGTFQATNRQYGLARVDGRLGGTWKDPRVNGTLTATGVTYNGVGPLNASAKADLKSRILSIDDIQAQLKNSVIQRGTLRLNIDTQALNGDIPEIRVHPDDFTPDVHGTATASAVIAGTVAKPTVRITGSSNDLNIAGTGIDSLQFTADATPDSLYLTELTARQREGTLSASGNYDLKTEAIQANARVSDLRIEQVPDFSATASLTADIGGTINSPQGTFNGRLVGVRYRNEDQGDLDVAGTIQNSVASIRAQSGKYAAVATAEIGLKEPYTYSVDVKADHSPLAYQQYSATLNGSLLASGSLKPFSADRIRFDNFVLRGLGMDLTASGVFPDGARLGGTADLAELPVSGLQLTGQARVQAVVSGSLESPQIEGSVETSNASLRAEGMPEAAAIQAAVDFTRNEFMIRRLSTTFAGATATISGRGTLQGTGEFTFRADGIRPERIAKDQGISGIAAVEGNVKVDKPGLDGISGAAKVTQLELVLGGIPIHQVEPAEVRFENQILSAKSFTIEGLNTRTTISGNTDLRTRAVDVTIDGNTDLKVVEAFLPGSNPSGQIRTNVRIRGTPEAPNLDGSITLAKLQIQIADPPVTITDTNAQIQVRGDRLQIASLSGMLNGGMITASGGAEFSAAGLGRTSIQLTLTGAQTEYPEGFLSEISSRLALNGTSTDLEVTGNVDILSGVYARDIDLTQEVFARITASSPQFGFGSQAQPSAVDRIKLNIGVNTPGFVSVANNLAKFDMDGTFQLRGTVGNPVITGRATVAEGGEIYFGPQVGEASATQSERRDKYVITDGSIDFINTIRTEPNFNIVATREVRTKEERYVITLHASGTPDDPKTELTSDPELDEPNIVALLLTGRTLKDLQGSELLVAQEQAANYLSGRFGNLFQTAGSAFGLNTVRIDPVLLARDEDLSAKLTVGKDITQHFNLVYSQNLSGPRAQTWIANYQALQDLLIRGINLSDDNKLTVELRHDLKWGGGPALPKGPRSKDEKMLGNVTFEGSTIAMRDLLKQVTKSGKPFSTYRMNEDMRKLKQFLAERDFLSSNIRAVRSPRDSVVDVHFVISEGPSITFVFEGAKVPKHIQQEIRQIWIRGFAELSSLRLSQSRLLRYLRDDGYLQAKVGARDASPNETSRRFVFDIAPGQHFNAPEWVFKGTQSRDLNVTAGTVLEDPKAIRDQIVNLLFKDGYLNASATEPRLVIESRTTRFEVSVEPGPRYTIGNVTASASEALRVIPPGEGGREPAEGIFTSAWLDRARQSIINKYWENGFNDVEVTPKVDVPKVGTTVNVDFTIEPGKQQIVSKIEIEGNKTTDTKYVQRQFTFKEGDPVDHARLNRTRKNLYDTLLFKRVDLNVVEGDSGYIARTRINEKPPWNFRYGLAVTDQLQTSDREFGATADFSYANLFGKGITAGLSGKYTADTHEGRVFSSLPFFVGKKVTTTGAVNRTRDLSLETSISDIWGFTIQQQWHLSEHYILSYDYKYERVKTFSKHPDPDNPFDIPYIFPVARFNGTVSHDSRDDILNATKGAFLSNSFEIAPPGVGSSLEFVKNFSQYFRFQAVRPHVTWATGVRMGVAKGFHGQQLIPTEQFMAGGGTTVRGYQQDKLTDPGDALLVLNQELRFPLLWRFSGVGFMDVGNVYPTLGKFNPFKLRYSPGAGLRIQTPLVLIRFDMGFNTAPRRGVPGKPDEERYRFSFGVGQAF